MRHAGKHDRAEASRLKNAASLPVKQPAQSAGGAPARIANGEKELAPCALEKQCVHPCACSLSRAPSPHCCLVWIDDERAPFIITICCRVRVSCYVAGTNAHPRINLLPFARSRSVELLRSPLAILFFADVPADREARSTRNDLYIAPIYSATDGFRRSSRKPLPKVRAPRRGTWHAEFYATSFPGLRAAARYVCTCVCTLYIPVWLCSLRSINRVGSVRVRVPTLHNDDVNNE